jgi:nicotinamidase-related amidase
MDIKELFTELDRDRDGVLSRKELHYAAMHLGWHWQQAPIYAVLDFLTALRPLTEPDFTLRMEEIFRDPLGPYGQVLKRGPSPSNSIWARAKNDTALVIIDPQLSFTEGAWMRSFGPLGQREVEPIKKAFANCGFLLDTLDGQVETMFTRCPFPPDSYNWDQRVSELIPSRQPYFVKPGNSVLWPPTNGFDKWVNGLLSRGRKELVIGGCTLNSCVRVSAIEICRKWRGKGLQVVVDLSLCGARLENTLPSPLFDGLSSVAATINEMEAGGVKVVEKREW